MSRKISALIAVLIISILIPAGNIFSQNEGLFWTTDQSSFGEDLVEISETAEEYIEETTNPILKTEGDDPVVFDDTIQIDGRTYKVAPTFAIPQGIDINSPVKINFDEETHEVLSIERLVDDNSASDHLEYHFGIVNAISKAGLNLQYRVYVDGIGYLFDNHTKIDETIAFLDKYASVAVITYKGKAVMCKVFASNTAVNQDDIFWGPIEHSKQTDSGIEIVVNGTKHIIDENADVLGAATVIGQWVFGYEIGDKVKFVSVITDSFPISSAVSMVKGFVTFTGNVKENGIYYVSIDDKTYRVMPDAAVNDQFQIGEYVVGYELDGDILTANRVDIPYDRSRYQILYEPISDVSTVTDYTVPGYKRVVSIVLGGNEIPIDSILNPIGEFKKDTPVMAIFRDNEPQLVMEVESIERDRVPVYGYVTSVSGRAPNYELIINGKKYVTNFDTVMAAIDEIVPGTQITAVANQIGVIDLLSSFESVLPNTDQYLYAGAISKIAVNAFQIDDRIIDYDPNTIIKGTFKEGKFAAVSKIADYAEMIYIIPDDYTDYNYHAYSGVLNGLKMNSSQGRRAIKLDEEVFYIDDETRVSKNLVYDEIGTALYKGLNKISVVDVLSKPSDHGVVFGGKILKSSTDKDRSRAAFVIGNDVYNVNDVTALIGFSDVTRIYPGATVEGYAYGDNVLAIELTRGAGLFGILNPPWMEYVLVAAFLFLAFIILLSKLTKNRTYWVTGTVDIGASDTIIINEENGKVNSYTADPDLFDFLTSLNEQIVTVKVKSGKIIEIK